MNNHTFFNNETQFMILLIGNKTFKRAGKAESGQVS